MGYFSLQEFNVDDTKTKLCCVIMDLIYSEPLKAFGAMTSREKKKFNERMNEYILAKLAGEDWDEVLTKDFNECMTAVFESKSYDPAKFCVPTNYDAELLLSEEQKQLNQTQDK